MNPKRVYTIRTNNFLKGLIVYWMSREQRVYHNWGFSFAQQIARQKKSPLAVVFTLTTDYLGANLRHYHFMLEGLKEVEKKIFRLNIPFVLLIGNPVEELKKFAVNQNVTDIITDFDPLTIKRKWQNQILIDTKFGLYEVDSHNIVPCRIVSNKQEYGAYTIRPKIKKLLNEFLEPFPEPEMQKNNPFGEIKNDWISISQNFTIDRTVKPIPYISSGEDVAKEKFRQFTENTLSQYAEHKNNPNLEATSGMSVYLHFGQISSQQMALEILINHSHSENTSAFLEELIIRKELSDNFCFYNKDYETVKCFPNWAKESLQKHQNDYREYLYNKDDFEYAKTHDELWNAAQKELVNKGKIHGYVRMYWAKKILEWSASAEAAYSTSVYLNDKYALDGRDPNGYTGCAWSIGGVHDRPWPERPVFGKIRSMTEKSMRKKIDVDRYISVQLND